MAWDYVGGKFCKMLLSAEKQTPICSNAEQKGVINAGKMNSRSWRSGFVLQGWAQCYYWRFLWGLSTYWQHTCWVTHNSQEVAWGPILEWLISWTVAGRTWPILAQYHILQAKSTVNDSGKLIPICWNKCNKAFQNTAMGQQALVA